MERGNDLWMPYFRGISNMNKEKGWNMELHEDDIRAGQERGVEYKVDEKAKRFVKEAGDEWKKAMDAVSLDEIRADFRWQAIRAMWDLQWYRWGDINREPIWRAWVGSEEARGQYMFMSVMTKTEGKWIYERVNAALACAEGTPTEAKHWIGVFRDRGETCWLQLVNTVRVRALMGMLGMIEGEWQADAVWKWVQELRREEREWEEAAGQIRREREEREGIDAKEGDEAKGTPGNDKGNGGEKSEKEERDTGTQTESAEDVVRWLEGLNEGEKDMLIWDGE